MILFKFDETLHLTSGIVNENDGIQRGQIDKWKIV